MGRGRPKKDKFDDLDSEFKDSVASMDEVAIRSMISTTALDQATLMKAKDDDEDLAEKKALALDAGAVYREGTKHNKLKILFGKRILEDRGKL